MNSRYFSITCDVDWASEECLKSCLDFFHSYGVKPTLFITHYSEVVSEAYKNGSIEVGLHPNFFSESSQGNSYEEVIEFLTNLYPMVDFFRCHSFYENTPLLFKLRDKGFNYDSNLCLYLQEEVWPLKHGTGLIRFPVFWEDDIHFMQPNFSWNFQDYCYYFQSSGIKILNIHPFLLYLNIPNREYYKKTKSFTKSISEEKKKELEYDGKGVRTFLEDFFKQTKNEVFLTLPDLYEKYKSNELPIV